MNLTRIERISPTYAVCYFDDGRTYECRGDAAAVSRNLTQVISGACPFTENAAFVRNVPGDEEEAYTMPLMFPPLSNSPPVYLPQRLDSNEPEEVYTMPVMNFERPKPPTPQPPQYVASTKVVANEEEETALVMPTMSFERAKRF